MAKNYEKFSHTMLSTWRRCRQKWWWAYMDGYAGPVSLGLIRGGAGHLALETYYRDPNRDMNLAIEAAWAEYRDRSAQTAAGVNQEDWEMLEQSLRRYAEWAKVNDDFTVVETEWKFETQVGPFKLGGFIDGVVERNGGIWLLEHKFNKRVTTQHLDIDPQVSLYMLAAQKRGLKPQGVLFNIIRMGGGPTAEREPVVRVFLYRNMEGLAAFENELILQMDEIHAASSVDLPEDSPVSIYRNMTHDCSWDCPFFGACLSLNDSGEAESVLRTFDRKNYEGD